MSHPAWFFFGIAFWIFMGVAVVAGIVSEYKKRQLELGPLRAAIERGQQLDPALIERLMGREQRDDEVNPLHLRIAGIIAIASGVGLALLAVLLAQTSPRALFPVLGIGALAVCVGVGLSISARAVEKYHSDQARRG